jgi:replicative DNA helicase
MAKNFQKAHKSLRVPPQNIDSERALIGSIMLRNDAINEVLDTINTDCFYSEKHQTIWSAIMELHSKGDPIDLLSLSSKLQDRGKIEQIGGATYLTELVNTVPSSANIKYYAEIVHTKYTMRRLIEASEFISSIGYDESEDLAIALDKSEKKIFEITSSPTRHKFTAIKDSLVEAWDRLDTLHNSQDELRGIPTGFADLDHLLAGLQKSDLIILAARPSMGKTSLALDIARQAAVDHNIPVGIFSLEMGSQQLVDRMLAADSKVDAWKLRTGKLKADEDFNRIRDSLDKLAKAPIYIDDQPGNNILKMRSVARKLKSEHGLGLIIVDYLQLMMPTSSRYSDSMVNQVTEISRSLKNLARELEVPVLALSQLSRAVEQRGGKPRLSDLRDSGSIEQDADVVMFIHREDKYNDASEKPNVAEILVEKHRNGPTGKVELYFDEKKTSFVSLSKSKYSDFAKDFAEEDF